MIGRSRGALYAFHSAIVEDKKYGCPGSRWFRIFVFGFAVLASVSTPEFGDLIERGRDAYRKRQLQVVVEESAVTLSEMFSQRKSPSSNAIRRERAVLLADALAHLPEDHRRVIVLRHLRGLTLVEVAQQMGRSYESVKKIWKRAVQRMQELRGDEV